MAYATPLNMSVYFGYKELEKMSRPWGGTALPELLIELTVTAGDRSAYTQDERDAADAAVDSITKCCADASQLMDSYFAARYELPLSVEQIAVNPLSRKCADIARYFLSERRPTEDMETRYNAALTWLRDIGAGKAGLVSPVDPGSGEAENSPARMTFGQGAVNTFDFDGYF